MKINGLRLKNARKKVKLTQSELADYLNISRRQIINYEQEKQSPSEETMIRIVKRLNKPIRQDGFTKRLIKEFTLNYFIKD